MRAANQRDELRALVPCWLVAVLLAVGVTAAAPAAAAPNNSATPPTAEQVRKAVEAVGPQALETYRDLLSLPNDALRPADLEVVLDWLQRAFEQRGFVTTRLASDRLPLLLAERRAAAADAPTVLIYLQADGQPVDPQRWQQASPWTPVLKEATEDGVGWRPLDWNRMTDAPLRDWNPDWRVFARSASDSKGPIAQCLAALDAIAGQGWSQPFHLKVIIDPEEELGSPNLPPVVERERRRLAADRLVIFDGPGHPSGAPTLVFGARGIATITLETYGPRLPQHSGHFGNYVPNPALGMARLLASMKDDSGRVIIPGYYDGVVLSEADKAVLASVPLDTEELHRKLGISRAEGVAATLQEAIQYPSLNIRGLRSGWVGDQARTIIPATATAEIDVRLVIESDPQALLAKIRQHIEAQGFTVIDSEPNDDDRFGERPIVRWNSSVSYGAFRTPLDSDLARWLTEALTRYHGAPPILLRTLGGSIPISPFVSALSLPAATVPTVNPDNNQHSPNENLRLGDFVEGIGVMISVLTTPIDL